MSRGRQTSANLIRTFRLIFAAAPGWTAAWSALLLVGGLLPAATVYLTKLSVDGFIAAKTSGGDPAPVRHALVCVASLAVALVLTQGLQGLADWVRAAQSELIQDHVKGLVHEQSSALDVSYYESPEYFDRQEQANGEGAGRPQALLESCGTLAQSAVTLAAMGAMLLAYGLWVPFVLVASTAPAFYVVWRFDRTYHRWWQRMTPERRRTSYYDAMLTHAEAAAEMRLFDLSQHFIDEHGALRRRIRTERLAHLRRLSVAKLGASVAALAVSGAVMAWMGWRVLHGAGTFGDIALFYQAFDRGQTVTRSLLSSAGGVLSNSLFVGNLFAFLDIRSKLAEPERPRTAPTRVERGVRFRDVSFRYPGSERPALEHFDLELPAGKIVAVVGENGAGKSTLLKLLCRFYDPTSGSVELDGVDLREYSPKDIQRLTTVLFQVPIRYHNTAAENIAFGDLANGSTREEVEQAARRAGAHAPIARLLRGYDTMLGKWFAKGEELSGGEWQRVALARAYLRRSPILILDEPTSFMDSWGEAQWFEHFRGLAEQRTAVVITHRFTIAMRADVIHVMDRGRIVESGSHAELLRADGLYATSWRTQMEAHTSRVDGEPSTDIGDEQLEGALAVPPA